MKSVEKLLIVFSLVQAVLCSKFSISLPESVEALRGLCVLIPCRFEINEHYDAELQKGPTGIWLKDGTDVMKNRVFTSKVTEENRIKGEITGDLRMKNCTTVFYNISESDRGVYYFRIHSGHLKHTYKSTSVSVGVRDSPISPSVRLCKEDQEEVEDQNEVMEGTSVRIICSAPSPPCLLKPPTFTWNFLPEERRQEQNHNTTFSSSQLNFNATHLHHGQDFTCTATYWLQNKNISLQSSLTLHVLYGPRDTSVSASPSASVVLGSSVSLSCSSDGNPAVLNYTWYRENGEQIGTGNYLTINTTDSTHSGLYYCRAQNQHGDHNSSVYLDVLYAPQVSPSSSCNSSMEFFNCSCEVHGNPSPKLVWLLSGQTVSKSDIISTLEESASNTTLRSFMSIRPSVNDTPTLQCVSTNNLGVTSQVFSFMTTVPCSAGGSGVNISSVLIGAAAGASVMMMLCGVFLCVRKLTPSSSGRKNTPGLSTVNAVCQEEEDYSAYVDKTDLEELLNYSTIVFPNGDGSEIRGISKLTADYATIHHNSEQNTDRVATEAATAGVKEENGINVDSEMMQEEEATYGNITRGPTIKQIS